jgi:hypothetical protein
MPTENEWLSSNIRQRLTDGNCNFEVSIKHPSYNKLDFELASEIVCKKLASLNKPIYIGLSGGIDSEYVFRKFVSLGYDVKPIIVCCSGNSSETPRAFSICEELNIVPVVIEVDEIRYLQVIYKFIVKKINGSGIATPSPIIAAMYAKDNNGIFIKCEHLIDEKDGQMYVGANEWDFYNDALVDKDNTYYFFMHTPEIVYSMVNRMSGSSVQKFKSELYALPYREKIVFGGYSNMFERALTVIRRTRIHTPNFNYNFGSKEQFLKEYF